MFECHRAGGDTLTLREADVLAAVAADAGHPAVAALLGLGASGLAGVVVAMAWNVNTRQIRLAEQLARRQSVVTAEADQVSHAANGAYGTNGNGGPEFTRGPGVARRPDVARGPEVARKEAVAVAGTGKAPVVIDGPDTVVTGEPARYRVSPAASRTVVSWAVGGGSVSQSPDPAHPDELLLMADRPGNLTVIVRVREGMAERRATLPVTAVPDVAPPPPPLALRLFLHGWGLIVVAVLVVGLAGALAALGTLTSSDFIALVVPLTAVLGMAAVARRTDDGPGRPSPSPGPSPGPGQGQANGQGLVKRWP
jgi:hypothetical protein